MTGEIFDKIEKLRLVPVVKIDCIEDALPLAEALCQGGLPVAEITFRENCIAARSLQEQLRSGL